MNSAETELMIDLNRVAVGFAVPAVLYLVLKNGLNPEELKMIDYTGVPMGVLQYLVRGEVADFMRGPQVGLELDLSKPEPPTLMNMQTFGREGKIECAIKIGEKWDALKAALQSDLLDVRYRKLNDFITALETAVLAAKTPDSEGSEQRDNRNGNTVSVAECENR